MRKQAALQWVTQVAVLVVATAAHAVTLSTPPLHPDPGGRLACTAVNVGGRAIGVAAQIINDTGQDVTDFVATQWSGENDEILASIDAESSAEKARYCKITVTGGGRSQVRAALEAFDANGVRTAIVEAH